MIFDISKIKCKQIQIEVKAAKQGIRSVTHLKFEKPHDLGVVPKK